jgi:hypothetical protein
VADKKYANTEGVKIWKNKKNRFTVFELHYSADPAKRNGEYRDKMKAAMPIKKFQQEMEIQWDTHAGNPVYPDWNTKVHATKNPLDPEVGLPMIIGVDFGLTPAAVICQLQGNTLVVLRELTEFNMGAKRFTEKLTKFLLSEFPNRPRFDKDYVMFVDPSGFFRKDTDENTCAQILRDAGFKPLPGPVAWEERRTSVEKFLTTMNKGKPSLVVQLEQCKMLVKGFEGGYMYSDGAFEIEPNKIRPVKNEFSHCHDAFQYVCSGITKIKVKSGRTKIPDMGYSFSVSQQRSIEAKDE